MAIRFLLIMFATVFLGSSPMAAAAQNCVAGDFVSPPNNLWGSESRTFAVRAESEHFQLRWPDAGNGRYSQAEIDQALLKMEAIWDWFTSDAVGWPEPFCDSAEKHKVQVFAKDGFGLSGSGAGTRSPAMWVGLGTIGAVANGNVGGFTHEFTHTMQFTTSGLRNTKLGGWMWESHAEFMANQYTKGVGTSMFQAWSPHIYYGSTRLRYANWMFWNFLKDKYGFEAVNKVWTSTAFIAGQDPFDALKTANGWTQSELGDLFGEYAMKNVNWDYIDRQDNYDRGAQLRQAYTKNTAFTDGNGFKNHHRQFRLARMVATNLDQREFVVSTYFAPQRYGYNLVRLIPDAGANSIQVTFNGLVQDRMASNAQYGTRAYEPGAKTATNDWLAFEVSSDPASDWRWGVVAINDQGKSRYSAMQSGKDGVINFELQANDFEVYLTVAATPAVHHAIFWDQKYHTIYRYPYQISLSNALPDGYQTGYNVQIRNQFPAGRVHANGGGWVANGATVDDTAFVGQNAAVIGGSVTGNARIEDYATIWSGNVSDNAIVGGITQLVRNTTVSGNAEVRTVMSNDQTFASNTVITGDAILYGDLESHLGQTTVSKGVFTGFLTANWINNAEFGANLTQIPIEVTSPVEMPNTDDVINSPPNDAIICANEWGNCVIPAGIIATVWYGANGSWFFNTKMTGSIECSNAMFGDPIYGTPKTCRYQVTGAPTNQAPVVTLNQPVTQDTTNNAGYMQAVASDSDGSIAKVEFYYGNTLLYTTTSAPYILNWHGVADGRYELTAKAYDHQGGETTSNPVTVVVNRNAVSNNTPPTISLGQPVADAGNKTGYIEATAQDSDGFIAKVEFYYGETLLSTATEAPYRANWRNAPNGSYRLTARAYDNQGGVTTSEVVVVVVE